MNKDQKNLEISKMMGFEIKEHENGTFVMPNYPTLNSNFYHSMDQVMFDRSWSWLMEAFSFINDIDDGTRFNVEISGKGAMVFDTKFMYAVEEQWSEEPKLDAFDVIAQFAHKFNNNELD